MDTIKEFLKEEIRYVKEIYAIPKEYGIDKLNENDVENIAENLMDNDYLFSLIDNEIRAELESYCSEIKANFIDDKDKIKDLLLLSKNEFLNKYSYLTEDEYNNTLKMIMRKIDKEEEN